MFSFARSLKYFAIVFSAVLMLPLAFFAALLNAFASFLALDLPPAAVGLDEGV